MATAKKKPSAAQVAARKLFVARVKAGEFSKGKPKRKTAVKKKIVAVKKNPIQKNVEVSKKPANFPYVVQYKNTGTGNWNTHGAFKQLEVAKDTAQTLHIKYPKLTIRVMHYQGGAM